MAVGGLLGFYNIMETDVEHLQTCKLNSAIFPTLFPRWEKQLILMFRNVFAVG